LEEQWAKTVSHIPEMLWDTVVNTFWPPATIRAIGHEFYELWNTDWKNAAASLFMPRNIFDDFGGFWHDVWSNFLILLDFPLALWRRLNSILTLLMGYVTIILTLVGLFMGGPAGAGAGFALAWALGEALFASFVGAESISALKACLDLYTALQTDEEKTRDYLQFAASVIGIGIALVLAVVFSLLGALAKEIVGRIKAGGGAKGSVTPGVKPPELGKEPPEPGPKEKPEPEPGPIVDPWAVLAKKYGLSADVIELMQKSGIGPEVFDRILSRGVDADTAATTADYYGKPGISVLDALSSQNIATPKIVELITDAHSRGHLLETAELAENGTIARMMARGFDPGDLVSLLNQFGKEGVEVVDSLTERGVERKAAIEATQIAKDVHAIDDVRQLVASGNLENPSGLRAFMRQVADEVSQGQGGKLAQLREAARRASGGDRVSLEKSQEAKGQADVIDLTQREALQIKEVTSKDPSKVAERLGEASRQLRGETGEAPPPGFKKIADIRVVNEQNRMFKMTHTELLEALREEGITQTTVRGVDEIRVTNGSGPHIFAPTEF
jgi:hypothetical protein